MFVCMYLYICIIDPRLLHTCERPVYALKYLMYSGILMWFIGVGTGGGGAGGPCPPPVLGYWGIIFVVIVMMTMKTAASEKGQ